MTFLWCFSSSTWTPKGDYIASSTDECTTTLSYAVSLKKPGTVSFEYFYPDTSIFFEFFVSVSKMTWWWQRRLYLGRILSHLWPIFAPPVGSEWPMPVYRLREPMDEDLWEQLEQIRGLSECSVSTLLLSSCHLLKDSNKESSQFFLSLSSFLMLTFTLCRFHWTVATMCCTGEARHILSWARSNLWC